MIYDKIKNYRNQIRDPVYNQDGSMVFDCTLTTNEPDRDGDIVNPAGVKGLETAVVAYNHQKCNGIPVSTGAKILQNTVIQNDKELRVQILVKQTDEMFYCDRSGSKKSNGKLLDAVKNDQVNNISIGFRYDTEDTETIYKNGKKYTLYKTVILNEFSLLDVVSSNINSIIHKTMKTKLEKQKCISCLVEAGIGSYVVNMDGLVAKITEINGEEVKAKDFDGNELILDDMYEPVQQMPHKTTPPAQTDETQKACSCQQSIKPEAQTKEPEPMPLVDPEEVQETAKLDMLLENQASIINTLADITSKIEAMAKLETAKPVDTAKIVDELAKQLQSKEQQFLDKFVQNPENKKTNNLTIDPIQAFYKGASI